MAALKPPLPRGRRGHAPSHTRPSPPERRAAPPAARGWAVSSHGDAPTMPRANIHLLPRQEQRGAKPFRRLHRHLRRPHVGRESARSRLRRSSRRRHMSGKRPNRVVGIVASDMCKVIMCGRCGIFGGRSRRGESRRRSRRSEEYEYLPVRLPQEGGPQILRGDRLARGRRPCGTPL